MLSQALVAYAIEFDNEFERRLRETWARPFVTSIVMWSNFMRFVPEAGTSVGEVTQQSCLARSSVRSLVGGLERWKYIEVGDRTAPTRSGFGSARGVTPATQVRPSVTGALAQQLWSPLVGEIDGRWGERLGKQRVAALQTTLASIQEHLAPMPRFLPVVGGKGLFTAEAVDLPDGEASPDHGLPTLLSRVLLAFTLDYEAHASVSLPIAANALRVAAAEPVPVRDIPLAAGVSKEAVGASLTWLQGAGLVYVGPAPDGRGKAVSVTPAGATAQAEHTRRLDDVEQAWSGRFGRDAVETLRGALEAVVTDDFLRPCVVPPDGAWRSTGRYKKVTAAFVENPTAALPQHPMVLHRGGWPDGS